jgi:hypothetical protein
MALVVCLSLLPLFACKSEVDQGIEYSGVNTFDWVQANVNSRATKKGVLWFQLFDQVNEPGVLKGYQKAPDRVDNYPASIFAGKFIWMLVGNRFEIRLMSDEASPDYQDTEKLKGFIRRFDLKGMENYKGPKLTGDKMKEFIPKL